MKRQAKVTSIGERRAADQEREAHLLAEACAKSDPSPEAKAYVCAIFDADPEDEHRQADLTGEAMRLTVKEVSLGFFTGEAVRRRSERSRLALGYESASHAERMLIDHVVMCDVRLACVERLHSQVMSGTHTIAVAEHYERRLTMTHRRFERAMTALAKTRALMARAADARKPRAVGREQAA